MDEGLSLAQSMPRPESRLDVLPAEADGIVMPDQVLWRERISRKYPASRVRLARLALLVLWVIATALFACTLYRVLSVETPTVLQLVFLVLSTMCFAWVAIGSATAIVGFVWLMMRAEADVAYIPQTTPRSKTALLVPVYRENVPSVAAAIDAMVRDIGLAGAQSFFDVFILSDTQQPEERIREQAAFQALRAATPVPIYFRWRTPNAGKKAGNIREWVERFGSNYAYFVILDADSVMAANTLLQLALAMDASPEIGLIQTVPRLVGGQTLFARMQQFAASYYGPLLAAGLAAWHGPGSNYWGHNAIIRTRAFATCAGLPSLPGDPPFGGLILSHDFVEAALLRRGGWEVRLLPRLGGSYEGCPPTLSDLIIRDRRWAQGNLQHLRLLTADGLPLLSRIHLSMGILAYLASPVWALTLLVGVVLAIQAKFATPAYFGSEVSLFPKWPVFDARTALMLFLATVVVVHLPKLLGAVWASRSRAERQRQGGVFRIAAGTVAESLLSTLIAPILMLTQTAAVLGILAGKDVGWAPQRRVTAQASTLDFFRQHRWHLAWGLAGAAICWSISLAVLAWMSPILLGLIFSAPLSQSLARPAGSKAAFLLGTPEEHEHLRLVTREKK